MKLVRCTARPEFAAGLSPIDLCQCQPCRNSRLKLHHPRVVCKCGHAGHSHRLRTDDFGDDGGVISAQAEGYKHQPESGSCVAGGCSCKRYREARP